ncbi:speckle-type POZ protein B [Trichonephila clavipes]|nr:speckle-type POZ protein B [Trichonephila clavipes]
MATNSNVENEPCVTYFWEVENYRSYICFYGSLGSPHFQPESVTYPNTFYIQLSGRGTKLCFTCSYRDFSPDFIFKCTDIEFELAILSEDGAVLLICERQVMIDPYLVWVSEVLTVSKDVMVTRRESFLTPDILRLRCRLWRNDGKTGQPVMAFARTVLKVTNSNFLWSIEKFSSFKSIRTLTVATVSGIIVHFTIEVNGENITIRCNYAGHGVLNFQSFIIDTNGSRIECGKDFVWPSKHYQKLCTLLFTKKYLMDNKNVFLKNDVLSLHCECTWLDGFDIHRIERIDIGISYPFTSNEVLKNAVAKQTIDLKMDWECMHCKGILSDAKLRTATQTFNANKAILCNKSPVFHALLSTDMKEKIQECVDVPDLEDDTVCRMLRYVYTDALEGMQWESALKLYAAADKYEIVTLKNRCSSFLKCNLSPNNLCDVLIFADIHADGDLKEAAQIYVLEHEQNVYQSDEWKEFAKNNSNLAVETMLLKWNQN